MNRTTSSAHSSPSSPPLSIDDRRHIICQLPTGAKSLALATGRIYHAPLRGRQDSWKYTGLKGMLVFGRNRLVMHADRPLGTGPGASFEHKYWFKLVDMTPGRSIIWSYDIPADFNYRLDKPFFHYFAGKSRMFGLRFDEDADADNFFKKITSYSPVTVLPPRKIRKPSSSQPPVASTPSNRVHPSMISPPDPNTFRHVGHVGHNEKGRLEVSDNLGPEFKLVLQELQGSGITLEGLRSYRISPKMVAQDKDFVQGFLQGAEATRRGNDHGGEKRRKTPHRKPVVL